MEATTIEGKDIILLLLGAAIGFVLGLIGNVIMLYSQFLRSIAAYRVDGVAEAGERIMAANANGSYTGILVDRYRFSLGVIIDEFTKRCFEGTFKVGDIPDNGPWPCLVDFDPKKTTSLEKMNGKDRWARFLGHVRPVMDDINDFALLSFVADHLLSPFLFLNVFPTCLPLLRLQALSRLCREIETTVGVLDGAFERRIVELTRDNQIQAVDLDEFSLDAKNLEERKAHQAELSKAYQELSQAWGAWRKLSGPRLN